ncbi:hypothetical protein [Chelativorans sp. AA-79]|uniref:hypothetical protein n=1 Tax=Chelativorans sp. AA-79 TaxID=3028735 RepID=UPI0023F71A7C|nr:hypothetical protein [Chelativorans sp. AA-79]WEX08615.1 hypothetical protein PVE73_21515 [Chelativorans sp. AA-79]
MSAGTRETRDSAVNWRMVSAMVVVAGALLFIGANAHLVYVALGSQPDCVPHEKADGNGTYRAARSAC